MRKGGYAVDMNYGERAGNRPALFYDLPACKRAFEYQRSYRRTE